MQKSKQISLETIRKILKTHFKISYTKIRQKHGYLASIEFQHEKYIFMKILLKMMAINFKIIWFDESDFNFSYKNRKGWLNHENPYYIANFEFGKNLDTQQYLMACTFEKIVHWKNFKGTNNADKVIAFLEELKMKMIDNNGGDFSNGYFFLDSSKIHEGSKIFNYFKKKNLKIPYGVNNYSNFDHCEFLFRPIKIAHYNNIYTER